MKKAIVWAAVIALCGAGGYFGYLRYKKMSVRQDINDFIRTVSRGDLKLDMQEAGELVSRDSVDVFPPNKGFIIEVAKKEGEYVEKGDKIMMFKGGERMDSDQYVPVPILAPRAGLLTRCVGRYGDSSDETRAGKRINAASDCVSRVVDMNTLAVNLKISEIDIYKLKPAMPVDITFSSLPGRKFSGRVDLVAPMAEAKNSYGWGGGGASKVFRVVISIDKPVKEMRVGMSAVVTANIQAKKDALKAPIETLFQEGLNCYVHRQKEGYEAEKIQVFPGLRSETEAEIAGPLKPGDRLFTAAPETLR
ncbi:MAG: efflux RND transporter periplasmic adaptor subunit [Elusimicrobiales bacterium]